jgi:histone-lysine N-methyltransferase EZH2
MSDRTSEDEASRPHCDICLGFVDSSQNEVISINSETTDDPTNEIKDLGGSSQMVISLVPPTPPTSTICISSDSGSSQDEPSRLRSDEVAESCEKSNGVTALNVEEIKEKIPDGGQRLTFIKGQMEELYQKVYGESPFAESGESDGLDKGEEGTSLNDILKKCLDLERLHFTSEEPSGEGELGRDKVKIDAGESESNTRLGNKEDFDMRLESEFQADQKSTETMRSDPQPDGKDEVSIKSVSSHGKEENMRSMMKSETQMTGQTLSTKSTRKKPLPINSASLKAEITDLFKEYSSAASREERKREKECILKQNKKSVLGQVLDGRKNWRKEFVRKYGMSSKSQGGEGEDPVEEHPLLSAWKAESMTQPPFHRRITYALDKSIELPNCTTWMLTIKNLFTDSTNEMKYVPYVGDDQQVPETFVSLHATRCSLPSLNDQELIKYLAKRTTKKYGNSEEVLKELYVFCKEQIFDPLQMRFLQENTPSIEVTNQSEVSASSFDYDQKFRYLYCNRCHVYNCLIHKPNHEGSPYEREAIVKNGFSIDDDLPKKRAPCPKLPEKSCGEECCLHSCKDSDVANGNRCLAITTTNGRTEAMPEIESNSNDTEMDISFRWKDQCTILGSIYEGDCCKVAGILNVPCKTVFNYLKHKWNHDESLHKGDSQKRKKKKRRKVMSYSNSKKKSSQFQDPFEEEDTFNKYKCPGCKCKSGKNQCGERRCPCFARCAECDPDVCKCKGCKTGTCGPNGCMNQNMQKWAHLRLLYGKSNVAGWGIFLRDGAKKDQFICEYTGERITSEEADRRGTLYDELGTTFLFDVHENYTLDAMRIGCKSKFINHPPVDKGVKHNCYPRKMSVMGDTRIGLFAERDIVPFEELFFDYRFNNNPPDWFQKLKELEGRNPEQVEKGKSKAKAKGKKRRRPGE